MQSYLAEQLYIPRTAMACFLVCIGVFLFLIYRSDFEEEKNMPFVVFHAEKHN